MDLLISLLIMLLVAGAVLYIIRLAVPALGLPPVIVNIATIIVVVAVIIWLLRLIPAFSTYLP